MISKKQSLVICLLLSTACLLDNVASLKLSMLQKDSWQDFFGEDTHIQKASLPHPKVEKKEVAQVQIKVESEFTKTMRNARSGQSIIHFLFGILMITAAFPLVWMNERRQVRLWKLISRAEDDSVDLTETVDDQSAIKEENDAKLVRLHGKVQSMDGVQDEHVKSIKLVNGLVIERIVEKYEEIQVTQQDGSSQEAVSKQYRWNRMHNVGSQQPSYDVNQTFYAANARLGPYLIGKDSLQNLTNFEKFALPDAEKSSILEEVKQTFVNSQKVDISGGNIVIRMNHSSDLDIPGDMKIHWRYINANKEFTIMGQQMKIDDKGTTSFRQWNPDKLNVPWGEDNGKNIEVEGKEDQGAVSSFISGCIEKLYKNSFQEIVNVMKPGIVFKKQIIQELNTSNVTMSTIFRLLAWIMFCWGSYLLFTPVIALFKFIPLIGYAMANIISFATVIFAVVIGSITHLLTLTVAWILHRPLFGISLLIGVSLLVSLLFVGAANHNS